MCDMTACETPAKRYVIIASVSPNEAPRKRLELCIKHVELAYQLAEADLTKIVEYGALGGGPRWKIKGGK